MPNTIIPNPGPPRPQPPVQLPRVAEPEPQPPDIDPTLPGWSRGGIALLREATRSLVALLSPGVITQVGLFVAMIWGGNRLDSKIDAKHDDTKNEITSTHEDTKKEVVKASQAVTHEKLQAIKGDTKKLNAGIHEEKDGKE